MNHKAISPLDGRYARKLPQHGNYFSEFALMYNRCKLELRYALALDKLGIFPALSAEERQRLEDLIEHFSEEDYQAIKAIERKTMHDVKACEIFLREKTQISQDQLFHFALTSEDANNMAYNYILKGYLEEVQLPQIEQLLQKLMQLAEDWKSIPFPTKTHGQKASPSTVGKELAVYINRIARLYEKLKNHRFYAKLSGAVGNYSAMLAAFPEVDWLDFAQNFLAQEGFALNLATTQIEDHDSWAEYFDLSRRLNNIVMDLDVDCWLYISYELFYERSKASEVGSSTMPHKVNPINFENSEGNMMLSNGLLTVLSDKLCRSRMQRDLSDSTVERNMGVALAHAYMAIGETLRGLNKLAVNEAQCAAVLDQSPELLAEPIQTILKIAGVEDPYNLLKAASRGKKPTLDSLFALVDGLDISEEIKNRCKALRPDTYVGDAVRICELVLEQTQALLKQ